MLKSAFLREQKRYSQEELVQLLQGDESEVVRILKRLKEYGVLKAVKLNEEQKELSDLVEDDVEVADVEAGENEYLYVFTFVGIITIEGRVLKCYPKYLLTKANPLLELKQVIKVIEKYNSKEQIIRMYNEATDSTAFNMLAVMLWLLQDYHENGRYEETQQISEINGTGEINWDKTINETFTLISDNRPYYPEVVTRRLKINEADYFKRLHECIVTRCSKELKNAGLIDIFDILEADVSDEELDDFGETEYILDRIYKEINIQYNTRRQLLLKTLYSYIANSNVHIDDMDCFSLFGTNSFNLIWEDVCAETLSNQLNRPLGVLELPVPLGAEYKPNKTLKDVIDHPIWWSEMGGEAFSQRAKDSLIPDIISIYKEDEVYSCVIFDAKYYNLTLEKNKPLKGQPGVESVAKQYFYQMAYIKFLQDHGFRSFHNCFLMPTEGDEIIAKGHVLMEFLKKMNLEDIQIRLLPAERMYKLYLENEKLTIQELNL